MRRCSRSMVDILSATPSSSSARQGVRLKFQFISFPFSLTEQRGDRKALESCHFVSPYLIFYWNKTKRISPSFFIFIHSAIKASIDLCCTTIVNVNSFIRTKEKCSIFKCRCCLKINNSWQSEMVEHLVFVGKRRRRETVATNCLRRLLIQFTEEKKLAHATTSPFQDQELKEFVRQRSLFPSLPKLNHIVLSGSVCEWVAHREKWEVNYPFKLDWKNSSDEITPSSLLPFLVSVRGFEKDLARN